jgi:hypothetical protein
MSSPATTTDPAEQQFATNGPVELVVKLAAADIEIATGDPGDATVLVEGAPKAVAAARVTFTGNCLRIERPGGGGRFGGFFPRSDGPLRVRVRVPRGSQAEIAAAAGNTAIDGELTGLEFATAAGDLRTSGLIEGDANVKSVSGEVDLDTVTGDLSMRTVSGGLRAANVGGSLSAQSVSGDTRVGRLREGSVTIQTVSGQTELGVAPGTNIDVDLGTASGDLHSEIPLTPSARKESGPTLRIRGNSVSGGVSIFRAS